VEAGRGEYDQETNDRDGGDRDDGGANRQPFVNHWTEAGDPVKKVVICHSRQPQPSSGQGAGAQGNPYGPSALEVSVASIFSTNGHDTHNGPVFNNTNQDFWGDIIPPFYYEAGTGRDKEVKYYAGMNWTAAGQAIYNADCQHAMARVTFRVDCDARDRVRVILRNQGDAEGKVTVNDTEYTLAAGERKVVRFEDGSRVVIVIDGQTVYDEVVTCNDAGVLEPNMSYSYVCDVRTETFKLTLTNSGNAEGSVVLNDENVTVPAGETKEISLPAGGDGVDVTLVVNEETVLDQTFVCIQGRGNVVQTPTTPVAPLGGGAGAVTGEVTSLPVTSGTGEQFAAIAVMISSILATAGTYALRGRATLPL